MAPAREEILDHNITYNYSASLILGTLSEIRAYAVAHRRAESRPDHHFALDHFQEDRQHFVYVNADDGGLPIRGGLRVNLDRPNPQILLPESRWEADSMPILYVTAAFRTHDASATISWAIPGEGFTQTRRVSFQVVPDGVLRTYVVSLAGAPGYTGTIARLQLDPGEGGIPGDSVTIASISFRPPDASPRTPRIVARPN
jgi:hypothetical protein